MFPSFKSKNSSLFPQFGHFPQSNIPIILYAEKAGKKRPPFLTHKLNQKSILGNIFYLMLRIIIYCGSFCTPRAFHYLLLYADIIA
jgi:hypothetical protein